MKNFSLMLLASLIIKFLSIGLGLYTNRWLNGLEASIFAEYNQINALNSIILAVVIFGIPNLIQKIYTNNYSEEYKAQTWTIFAIIRFISFFVGLILVLITLPFTAIEDWSLTIILYSIQFLLIVDLHFRSIADAVGKSWWFSLTDFVVKFVIVAILIAFELGSYPLSFSIFLIALTIAYTLGLSLDFALFRKYVSFRKNIDFTIFKEVARPLMYVSLTAFIVSFYSGIDVLILGRLNFADEVINGYSNAYKIFTLVLVVPALLIPPLASYVKKNYLEKKSESKVDLVFNKILPFLKEEKRKIVGWSGISFLVGTIISIGLFFVGPFIISLVDPTLRYPDAVPSLLILCFGLATVFPTSFLANLLIFNDGEKTEFAGIIVITLISLVGYAILIPMYGAIGAALATSLYLTIDLIIKTISVLRLSKLRGSS
jgi:O-antigen/teichoic acid export membrane protein